MALKMKQIDNRKSTEAQTVDYDKETSLRVMPADNEQYQIALARLNRQVQRNDALFEEGKSGVLPGEKTEYSKLCPLVAEFILVGWSGVLDENDKDLPYSVEAATNLLKGNPEFFSFVLMNAKRISLENEAEAAEIKGKR